MWLLICRFMAWIVSLTYKREIKKLISDELIIASTAILFKYINKEEVIKDFSRKPYITELKKIGLFDDDFIDSIHKLYTKTSSNILLSDELYLFITYLKKIKNSNFKISEYKSDLDEMMTFFEYFLLKFKTK